MQKSDAKTPKKKQPRWRDLTDEEQWAQIYAGRKQKERAKPKTIKEAVALALPGYLLHMAIADCHATFQATVRHDVHTAVVTTIARVASLLPNERSRNSMATKLEKVAGVIRRTGFYHDNREFLYAVAYATVKLADDLRYPADSPACMAAIMLKDDAETDEVGDWSLSRTHAVQMAHEAYNVITETGLYGDPEEQSKLIQQG